MREVWIVEGCVDYEGCSIEGVFATEEAAQVALDAVRKGDRVTYVEFEITKWEVQV